jgi:hypothetical protein
MDFGNSYKVQRSQYSKWATADMSESLMLADHSELRNVEVGPQDFKNK